MTANVSRRRQARTRTVRGLRDVLVAVVTMILAFVGLTAIGGRVDAATTRTCGDYSVNSPPRPAVETFAERVDADAMAGPATAPIRRYGDSANVARTSAPRVSGFFAPQTGDDCGSSVVIGESTTRTREAAAAFGATIWIGPRAGASHLEKCAANETWIRSEIQRGTHIIDIGIDSSRQETRSPYYALELRELAAANYPVERQPWGPSLNQYVDEDYGGPCP